jgi:hypothetical protein
MVSQLEQLRSTSIPEMLKTSLQSFSKVRVLLEAWEGWVEEVPEEEDLVMAFLVASVVDQMLHMVVDQMEEEELLPTVILASSSTTHNNNMLAGRPAPVETKLLCTLEELYKGSVRKMKISRNLADPSRNTLPVEEILTIKVKADWKKGTKVTFRQKGNELKTR